MRMQMVFRIAVVATQLDVSFNFEGQQSKEESKTQALDSELNAKLRGAPLTRPFLSPLFSEELTGRKNATTPRLEYL
ncbi:hypothetical protein C8034_v010635 [Colletotrichum sidae]|uniref:Uncharacterized protein n=1 Tax=Colletotrichum sidae TaxID=1347389 RepID=A0A4R8TA33_9PEZI|nr:hypothetical protein C8034_v010635 [Colletotrichum sidae]